jgi:hypothetical protein
VHHVSHSLMLLAADVVMFCGKADVSNRRAIFVLPDVDRYAARNRRRVSTAQLYFMQLDFGWPTRLGGCCEAHGVSPWSNAARAHRRAVAPCALAEARV